VVSGPDVAGDIERVITLGASNLTRGFHTVVSTARAVWGPRVQVLAAFGHGRSYGTHSRVLVRTLPGILDSGLWRDLDALPPVPTRALVTDVGNDILYGFPSEQVVAWAEAAVDRLERTTRDITLTDLPLASVRRLSSTRFLVFRSILFPSCRMSLAQAVDAAEHVNAGLEELSAAHCLRFFRLKPEWYGLDPIHIRPSLWRTAWQEILGCEPAAVTGRDSRLEGLRLYLMPPERRWLFGIEQRTPQTGRALVSGGKVWLY
jgi:hypothetical protein